MSERNELTERDRQLLEEIDEIVANGGGERREADSLYGLCAHLASTVPQADDAFQQQLEARLIAGLQQQQEVRTLGATSQDKGEARSPSWPKRLAQGVGRIRQIFQAEGGLTMKKGFALAALAALVIAVGTVGFVPSVRAQVSEFLNTWFRIEVPGGAFEIASSDPAEFTPLQPTYLPDAVLFGSRSGSYFDFFTTGGKDKVSLFFGNLSDQWINITQSPAPANRTLPEGKRVQVNEQEAVLLTGQSGELVGPPPPINECLGEKLELPPGCLEALMVKDDPGMESAPLSPECQKTIEEAGGYAIVDSKAYTVINREPLEMKYENAMRLSWYAGNVKVEMLSNLPEEEMLKIAASLVPAEAEEDKPPFQPPLDFPSGGEGKVIETEGGRIIIHEGPIESNP